MDKQKIKTFGNYSPIKQAGNFYYISGQIGYDAKVNSISDNIEEQAKQALENLNNVIKSAGLNLGNIVKVNQYLLNIDDFKRVDKIYGNYFSEIKPARSTIGVKELPKVTGDIKVLYEIDAIAYREK